MKPFPKGGASVWQDGAWKRTRYMTSMVASSNLKIYCCWTLAKKYLYTVSFIFHKCDMISCVVNGARQYSADLVQGGLGVCYY